MSDATGPVQTGALCYFDWTCSECNRLVVAGEWHKHALIGHGVTDRALADVQILTEKVESLQSQLQAKTRELKETLAQRSTRNWVDMTPDSHLPERLLSCYIDESYWSDNTGGVPATNPAVVAMNEHREQRNAILRAALAVLDAARKDAK